ncbi:hypothetical protein KC19_6G067300 [Ceratodon purpureus]|uniref:Uncharacterized protein n=1 Tax=Ceratodon purpureus TaxID=3225 RepID=A0A8T0HDX1_CERPU|nr:hypothetical protein KC19_6G067300 [Ceratodon purpureus]
MAEPQMSMAEKMAILTGRKKVEEKPPTPPPRVPEKHPPGVGSLFISDETCKKFNIEKKIDTENNIHFKADTKMVKEDIKNLGAESNFFPLKDMLMNYHEEYFLLRYIADDRYVCNHNFELVYLVEVRDAIIKELEDRIAAAKAAEGPRFWMNLGSDMEVDAEIVKDTRDPVLIQATKKRKDYYLKAALADREAYETWTSAAMECRPFSDPSFDGQFMVEQETATQAIPIIQDTGAQTVQKVHRNNQVQYQPITEDPAKIRDILSSKEMGDFLSKAKYRYVDALQQNEVFDLFEDEFAQFVDEEYQHGDKAVTSVSEYQSFSELNYGKSKMVSAIDWMPGKRGIVAVALTATHSFDERIQVAERVASSHVLLWTFADPVHPWAVLESISDVFCLRFNPVKPTIITGGCFNGQVNVWDITKAQDYQDARDRKEPEEPPIYLVKENKGEKKTVEPPFVPFLLMSTMATSHTSIVSDIHWLPKDFEISVDGVANNGETNLIASCSADGLIIFWDITSSKEPELDPSWSDERKWAAYEEQKYMWTPLYRLELKSESRRVGPLKMCRGFQETIYYCSTEFGEVAEVDLNIPTGTPNVAKVTGVHQGPVRAVLKSPFFDDVLFTVGIWTFALWRTNIEVHIIFFQLLNLFFVNITKIL